VVVLHVPFPLSVSFYVFCFIVVWLHGFRLAHRDLPTPMWSWAAVEADGTRLPSKLYLTGPLPNTKDTKIKSSCPAWLDRQWRLVA